MCLSWGIPYHRTELKAKGLHMFKKMSKNVCKRKIQILLSLAQESVLKEYHCDTYRVLFLFPKHPLSDSVYFTRCTSALILHIHLHVVERRNLDI